MDRVTRNRLQAKVAAAAKAIAREPIMAALTHAVRKVPRRPTPSAEAPPKPRPDYPFGFPVAKPKKRARASRVGFRRYSVVSNPRFKRGTWRAFMVATICAHTDTRSATAAHRESGEYPDKTLDFNWCVKQGYIAYNV